jgi:hypothetical protein
MNAQETKASEFNRTIMAICLAVSKKMPNDMDIKSSINKIKIAKDADKEILIKECGPYLFKYKDKIKEGDCMFILKGNFDESSQVESNELARDLFGKLTNCFNTMNTGEIAFIADKIRDLLKLYLEYLLISKK